MLPERQPNTAVTEYEDKPVDDTRDPLSLSRERLNDWRSADMDTQQWRRDSAIDEEYYDGNQYDDETAQLYKTYGLPLLVVNCIYNPINGVIGLQEKSLSDWVLRDDHDNEYEELAEGLSFRLKQAEREARADRACLDGFASQIKAGIGWVEVGDNTDPFLYPYRVDDVPWKEISWDMRARRADLHDAEYIRRVKYYRRFDVTAAFPNADIPLGAIGTDDDIMVWAEPERLLREHAGLRDMSRYSLERNDRRNDSIAVEEVWYKVRVTGYVFRMPDKTVRRFDEKNPAHMQAYYRGLIEPKPARFTKIRQSFWIGPHCLLDRWSPLPHDHFPYVPFIAHQEAATGVPYGLIRVMRPLQDEVNTRRAKMMANLNSVRVMADDDAVLDHDHARNDVAKRNAYIVLNSKRRNLASGFVIDKNQDLNAQQWEVYQDAVLKIQETSGIHQSLLGKVDQGVRSGVAIQSLVDQSITSLGRINANYREARKAVGELLFAHVVRDLSNEGEQEISWDRGAGERKSISVNVPRTDQAGYSWIENDVSKIRMKVVLDETPSTPTFRAQQFQEIVRTLDAMPPEVQQLMVPVMVEASELPNRKTVADMLRKRLGISQPKTPEEAAEMDREKKMQDAAKQGELAQVVGKGKNEMQKAQQTGAQIEKVRAETQAILQDIEMQAELGVPDEGAKKQVMYRW